MSEQKTVVAADMSFIQTVQNTPRGRRGSDPDSSRGKVREFFIKNVLDAMLDSLKTDNPVLKIEYTDIISRMRSMAVTKDGQPIMITSGKQKLLPGERWVFVPDEMVWEDRYRTIRNYLNGILKPYKGQFSFTEKEWSAKAQKDLIFLVLTPAAPVAAPVAAPKKK
jgi:hypothetical protein